MSGELITSVTVAPEGGHDAVSVWVRGQLAGTLVTSSGDGERIKNVLLSARYLGTDRPPDGPITRDEYKSWRVLAMAWLTADGVDRPTREVPALQGAVAQILLRLLDALHGARAVESERDALLETLERTLRSSMHAALEHDQRQPSLMARIGELEGAPAPSGALLWAGVIPRRCPTYDVARSKANEATLDDIGRGSNHELVRYWLDKTVEAEARVRELEARVQQLTQTSEAGS